MPSTFLGLNTGLSGLTYFQAALNTTSHNISNVNTAGYSKQQINATASAALRVRQSYGMMGTGVTAQNAERLRNNFYDNKYWGTNAKQCMYEAESSNLQILEQYMNEISGDSGYTKWLSKLSASLQDISDNPSDYTTRISYTLTADSFTDTINELSNNFQLTQTDINSEIDLIVSEINSLAKQIYELNSQVISIELKGANANDLRDKRDLCIDKLSQYVDVDVTTRSVMFGVGEEAIASNAESICVRINGNILVDDMEYNELMVHPREEKLNQNDAEGLVDVYWKNSDGTAGEKFNIYSTTGHLRGLFDVRDGNNGEGFAGEVLEVDQANASVKVSVKNAIHVDTLNIPSQGIITLNGKEYTYDGWTAEYNSDGYLNNFEFNNLILNGTYEVKDVLSADLVGHSANIGSNIAVKGIPYYQARLNEMVRTFSKYINNYTTAGVDESGEAGLDMFTALDTEGKDFILKGTMSGAGTVSSSEVSYYKLTALNWSLNSEWLDDPSKVVVSYAEDVAQGNVEARPIIEKIIYGLTDQNMFEQGTISQFMQAITTNMGVDIAKYKVFASNQDDIRYTIDNQRKSISGVDQNEEAADLVKFQNLYNLSSKVISVLNEVYNKLINETGV